ncbi:MAG: Dabb family protein [Fibrobacteres bacterium]|jgi:hypothetical protein|nr:Dabb family protein [Fibrobacterota bacterium]
MFVHAVYFWLKPDLSPAQVRQFEELATAMSKAPTVRNLWLGKPAATNRPVIERSYSYALTVVFDDAAGEAAYQTHATHDTFREKCGSFWSRVQIFDSI